MICWCCRVVFRCLTRSLSHTMQRCRCINWWRTPMKLTVLTTRLCTTSVSVHWSWLLRPTATSTISSLPPCPVSPLASASLARSEFTNSLCTERCSYSRLIVWLVRSWKCPIQVWTLFFHIIVGLIVCDSWLWNASHILRCLLPPESSASQNHNLQLPDYASHLFDSDLIMQMLFKDVY